MNIKDYSGVWVFAEQKQGILQKVSLELLGKGREIADKLGVQLSAVLFGSDVKGLCNELIHEGADNVYLVDNPLLKNYNTDGYAISMANLIKEYKPEIIFIGATVIGRDLGPRVAAKIRTGLTADCTGLDIDPNTKNLMMTRPAFGGNLMATIECADHRPQMSTVRPGVFEKLPNDENRKGNIIEAPCTVKESDIKTKSLEIKKLAKQIHDIGEAKILVSGGRGIGGPENFTLLKELADLLDGSISGSRAAIDSGWLEKAYQVGQTGKTVRPNIYFAIGISGAIQHLAGMQESEFIVAINKDEGAPIMKVADMAIVGDYRKVVPELINEIKSLSNN